MYRRIVWISLVNYRKQQEFRTSANQHCETTQKNTEGKNKIKSNNVHKKELVTLD